MFCFSAIFYYAVTFFKSAGIAEDQAKLANLGVGAIMVTMTFITIPLMDRLGRRALQLTSLGSEDKETENENFLDFNFSWHTFDVYTDHHRSE